MTEDKVLEFDVKKLQKLPIINRNEPGKKLSEKEEKHLRELLVFEFNNIEQPGLMQSFSYGDVRNKMKFDLFHGQKYRLPRFIARHVESCSSPIWSWRPDGAGSLEKKQNGVKRRFTMREIF